MGDLNRCEFIGRLGKDPEIRRMSSGDPVVNLSVAVSDRWTDRNSGEKRERTTWVPVVIFNENLAKVAEQYLRKGSKVFVAGEFSVRKWTDNSGNDRYSTEIVLNRFRGELQMLDGKSDGASNTSGGYADHSRGEGFERAGPDVGDGENFPF
jgi:single-strand DNA-binding protein